MTAQNTTTPTLDQLADTLTGDLTLPSDPHWDTARTAWNLAVDQQPAAVIHVASVRDVVVTIAAARELSLQVAAQGTGHNAAPLGSLADTILLRTDLMRDVQIDPDARVARVESGALWADVSQAAAQHGLAALAGSSHDVGVVGYTLGGGLSWLARSHGLAANHVVAIELVTADSTHRRVDSEHDPDLFWALRGGGGDFGVVTAIEFGLFPISEVYAGTLFWPMSEAARVLSVWRDWIDTVPDTVTSVGRILQFPPLPDLPDVLRGHSFVVVEAAMQVPSDEGDDLLAPLRALLPAMDTFRPTPIQELQELHMDPPEPVPGAGNGILLRTLDTGALEAFIAAATEGSALLSAELRHLGGAVTPGRVEGGAVSGLDADILAFGVGITPTPEAMAAVLASVDHLIGELSPWATETNYLNFVERSAPARSMFGSAVERLREVKRQYDPAGLIRSNHPVGD